MTKATVEVNEGPKTDAPREAPKPANFRKTVGPHRMSEVDLRVPEVFTKWNQLAGKGRERQFAYLTERLVTLARMGALSVTHIHQQPKPIPDYCGMIINRREFSDASNEIQPAMMPLDPALRDYTVKVQSVERDVSKILGNDHKTPKEGVPSRVPIGWKLGKQLSKSIRSRAGEHHSGFTADSKMIDVFMESDVFEADLPLVDAWSMLHQFGKHCVRAPTPSRQARMWLYEETIPEAAKSPPPEDTGYATPEVSDQPHMRRTTG